MYFDFQDGHPDLERVPSALSAREGVLVSIIVHLLVIIAVLLVPQLPDQQRTPPPRMGRRQLAQPLAQCGVIALPTSALPTARYRIALR